MKEKKQRKKHPRKFKKKDKKIKKTVGKKGGKREREMVLQILKLYTQNQSSDKHAFANFSPKVNSCIHSAGTLMWMSFTKLKWNASQISASCAIRIQNVCLPSSLTLQAPLPPPTPYGNSTVNYFPCGNTLTPWHDQLQCYRLQEVFSSLDSLQGTAAFVQTM